MTDENIAVAGMPPYQSPSVAQALQELAHMAVTEACVSGLCDICLAQQGCLCDPPLEGCIFIQAFEQLNKKTGAIL